MNDWYMKIVDGCVAILAGAVIWFSKRSVNQYDDRIDALERDAVRIASLQSFRDQLATELRDNKARLERIEDSVASTSSRIDDVFKFLVNRK
jgi:hypothetical protein